MNCPAGERPDRAEEGDPDGDIPAGTPFDQVPADWYCPVCGARKVDFSPFDE